MLWSATPLGCCSAVTSATTWWGSGSAWTWWGSQLANSSVPWSARTTHRRSETWSALALARTSHGSTQQGTTLYDTVCRWPWSRSILREELRSAARSCPTRFPGPVRESEAMRPVTLSGIMSAGGQRWMGGGLANCRCIPVGGGLNCKNIIESFGGCCALTVGALVVGNAVGATVVGPRVGPELDGVRLGAVVVGA